MSTTRPDIHIHPTNVPAPHALTTKAYDLIVIGAGPAGEVTAMQATRGGLTALIIESELVGGECPYWACLPSKGLLRPGEVLEAARAVGGAREVVGAKVDLEGVWKRRDFQAKGWVDDANLKLMSDHGVDVVRGFGRVSGEKRVSVQAWGSEERVEYEARCAVVVATGSIALVPDIEGLKEAKPWTPREAVSARKVPAHLVVLGAGPVGVEMATAYRTLGAKVTLIVSSERVLGKFEPEASRRVKEGLEKMGVDVKLSAKIKSVSRTAKEVTVMLEDGSEISSTEILVAAGRKAKTTDLGLEGIGLPGDGAVIDVDYSLCSKKAGWLYAVGDTNGISPLTHMAKYQGKIAGDSIVAKAMGKFDDPDSKAYDKLSSQASEMAVPQVTFSDPQVASVGMTEDQAKKKGMKVKIAAVKMMGPGTFVHAEGYNGWAQWVVEEESGRLLGATFVGRDVVDLLHASTVAIVGKMTVEQLWHAVPSFPTMGEVYTLLLEACGL